MSYKKKLKAFWKVASVTACINLMAPVFSVSQDKGQSPTGIPEVVTASTNVWFDLQKRMPYPFTIPLPSLKPTVIDGTYSKFELKETPYVHCRRCPDYAPEGGIWKLRLDKGVFRIFHEATGWRGLGTFIVTKDFIASGSGQSDAASGQLVVANDPVCQEVIGVYSWKSEEGKLVLRVIEDKCAIGLRAKNLTSLPWLSCQPPSTEAAITDHWPKPPGCE